MRLIFHPDVRICRIPFVWTVAHVALLFALTFTVLIRRRKAFQVIWMNPAYRMNWPYR